MHVIYNSLLFLKEQLNFLLSLRFALDMKLRLIDLFVMIPLDMKHIKALIILDTSYAI